MLNGKLIAEYLDRTDMKSKWLAKQIGVCPAQLAVMKKGVIPEDLAVLDRLKQILGCSMSELILTAEPRKQPA